MVGSYLHARVRTHMRRYTHMYIQFSSFDAAALSVGTHLKTAQSCTSVEFEKTVRFSVFSFGCMFVRSFCV